MSDSSSDVTNRPETNSKVGRVIEKYEATGLGADLEARWNGDGVERSSLRELADYFNRRVLRSAMESAGMSITDHDVEHVYSVLTDPDVNSGPRTQKRRELEREGVDVADLESDFVSHQAIHTYLRKYRDAEYERDEENRPEKARETLQRLRSRTSKVTRKTVETLRNADELTVGAFEVFVDVRVHCRDCGGDYDVVELLQERGCDCRAN